MTVSPRLRQDGERDPGESRDPLVPKDGDPIQIIPLNTSVRVVPKPDGSDDYVPAYNTSHEPCPRCGTAMIWVQSSYQCPYCRFKEGCCG